MLRACSVHRGSRPCDGWGGLAGGAAGAVPFGADAASEASTVYREQVAELRYLSQALDHAPDASTSVRPTPAVPSRLVRTLGASFSPLGGWSGSAIIVKPC